MDFRGFFVSARIFPSLDILIFMGVQSGVYFIRGKNIPPRMQKMLTDIKIKSLKPKDKNYKVSDAEGLFLLVHKNGSKYWRLKYRIGGKEKTHAIGVYPIVKLNEARNKRSKIKTMLAEGIDPSAVKKVKKEKVDGTNTFESIAREWHSKKLTEWTDNHGKEVMSSLERDIFPFLGKMELDDIDTPRLLQVLRRIETRGALAILGKVRQRCGAIFKYGITIGKGMYNPALNLDDAFAKHKKSHFNALERKDLPEFLNKLDKYNGEISTILGLKFILLTITRTNEVRFATWDEIDFENRLWTIPAERMKMKRDHVVPLSTQAMEVLDQLQKVNGDFKYIFASYHKPQIQPMSENAMLFGLYRMGYRGKATVHGFRATASTILNENGVDPDWIEKQLAHEQTNRVRAAYNRAEYLPQRTKMMQGWADLLDNMKYDN